MLLPLLTGDSTFSIGLSVSPVKKSMFKMLGGIKLTGIASI
jgi:hypothetical protein